jgi:hypothetical protein
VQEHTFVGLLELGLGWKVRHYCEGGIFSNGEGSKKVFEGSIYKLAIELLLRKERAMKREVTAFYHGSSELDAGEFFKALLPN